jgi:pimeloyl-ACP methyl ester carboxylesterase
LPVEQASEFSSGGKFMIEMLSTPESCRLEYRPGSGRFGLPCWLALPRRIKRDQPPLVAIHGIRRGAREQAQQFAATACATGRPVVAPLFDEQTWPLYQQVVRKGRADIALLGLIQELRLEGIWQAGKFDLVGFSGGGQFSHRFAMLYPHMINSLSVVSAGWYTFPDAAPFPYGTGDSPKPGEDWGKQMEARIGEFLQLPINIAVGALDGERDKNTRKGREIDRQQGRNRIERARNWKAALLLAAKDRNLPDPAVRFRKLPNCGHSFTDCVKKGGLVSFIQPGSDRQESSAFGPHDKSGPVPSVCPPT